MLEGVLPLDEGTLLTMTVEELGSLNVDKLLVFAKRLGVDVEGIETRTQALTRIISSAHSIGSDG